MAISTGLSIAISGLKANKTALDTVSNNISNVNNPDYVRQQAIHATDKYTQLPGGKYSVGTGVNVQQIRQVRDEFLDIKYRDQASEQGYWSTKSGVFEEVQGIMSDMNESGIQNVMDQFWNGWEELSKDSDNLTLRGLLKERAIAFTETVNHIGKQLDNLRVNLNRAVQENVQKINNIAKDLATVNEKILSTETEKIKANDYRDTRNSLLDKLSEIVNIDAYEDSKRTVNVSIGGVRLVDGTNSSEIEAKQDGSPFVELSWKDDTNNKVSVKQGGLAGILEARDKVITEIHEKLNTFVDTFATRVNSLHKKGHTLDGVAGDDFFVITDGSADFTTNNIKINDNLAKLNKIAASSEDINTTGERGNGDIAKQIANIREEYIFGEEPNKKTSDDFYRSIISEMGVGANEAATMEDSQSILVSQIDERRKSISAVSLDEEMADMLKYQHSYSANSRVVNALDEMADNIINRMGRVGR